MKVTAILLLPLLAQAACIPDSERCLAGFVYAPQYDACLALDSADASDDSAALASPDGASDGGVGGDGATGLGLSCNGSADCTGKASYCLKDPTANPTDPGICSIPQCTAAECTSAYVCCDCSAGLLAGFKTWPVGVCAPASNKSDLMTVGCTCQ